MKSILVLLLFSMILFSCSNPVKRINSDKHTDCEPIEEYNRYLWMGGTYETYMDNALRCFNLNSIGYPWDSCVRLWIYEEYSPDSSGTYYLNMFQFDAKRSKPYAIYYNLEWKVGKEKQQIVTCIRKKPLQPRSGWDTLKRQMNELQLNRIDTIPITRGIDDGATDGGLKALQYVYGETTITVDFTTNTEFFNSKYKKNKKYGDLIKLIKDEFSVNLFADHFNHDLFKIYPN